MSAPNQILLYDSAVANWVIDNFTSLVDSKDLAVLMGTPDRAFAEYVSLTQEAIRDGRLITPRCAITCEDVENDPERFNPGTLRLLGYTDATKNSIRRAEYPTPVKLNYTINFWSEYYREMNLYDQQMLKEFRKQYTYLSVDIDSISPTPVYGTKLIGLFNDSGLVDSGDVEPGSGERVLRRTINVHLNAWLWDFDFSSAYAVKEVELRSYDSDFDPDVFLEYARGPQREVLDLSPDGIDVAFATTTKRTPIIQQTFLVDAVVGGTTIRGRDNGSGVITDPVTGDVTGTIDYSTGALTLAYSTAPDAASEISAAFFTSSEGLSD